jgi:tRNA threonylcarbamoyladenosine biosynthesis protein TsaE
MQITTKTPEETRAFAATMAKKCVPGTVFAMIGTLGSGKTEFVRGFVASLCTGAAVRSPSFTLVNTYQTDSFPIHHFDFYRLTEPDELFEIGFDEYINDDAVCFIEWAEMFPEVLPENITFIRFTEGDNHCRNISVDPK